MNVLIAGYPYVRENYRRTFDFYPEKDKVFFLLPKTWKIKKGKVTYVASKRNNVYTTSAYFNHSDYPIIGGLLKGWMPVFPWRLWRLRREKKIGLVYDSTEPTLLSTLYNAFWSKLLGSKYIVFSWENIPYEHKFRGASSLVHKLILKLNLALADGVVCGNQKCRDIFAKLTSKPLAVIPLSGLDENIYKPSDDKSFLDGYGIKDKIVFTFIGAIGYRKGIHLLLESFKNVLSQVPDAHLVIAGSGEYEKKIEELINELNLDSYVTRIPWLSQPDVVRLLSASDVFLYPSISHEGWEEQFGYSMAEASLCGLPVIATKTGSVSEVVINGNSGLLVNENDKDELAAAIIRLAGDRELCKRMGFAGRSHIIENFSNERIAEKFREFFNSII